jgi:hypothetical protein
MEFEAVKVKENSESWRSYCDVHAAARFRGNKGGYLSND